VPNYEKKEEEELEKLEGKTNRLIELLNGRQPGENVSRHPEIQVKKPFERIRIR
jgi:hypothetical protein